MENFDKLPVINEYIIIGAKNAGKTVFFVSAVDLFQRLATGQYKDNEVIKKSTRVHQVEYLNMKTDNFVQKALQKMKQQKWPDETTNNSSNFFSVRFYIEKFHFWKKAFDLTLHDFPGGTYSAAFQSDKIMDSALVNGSSNPIDELKKSVRNATGVFLLIDCGELNNSYNEKLNQCLFNFSSILQNKTKVAIIFTKRDSVEDKLFSPVEKFRNVYANAWVRFQKPNMKFFEIASVNETEVNDAGIRVPMKGHESIASRDLIDPFCWMFDLESNKIVSGIKNGFVKCLDFFK